MPINTTDPTRPDYVRPEVVEAAADLLLIDDLLGGPQAMWENSGTYIRQWSDELDEVYNLRRLCEPVEDLFGRTLSASVGKLFAKPPKLEYRANEAVLRAQWDNLNGRGTKGDVALKEFASDTLAQGVGVILTDHPAPPAGVRVTAANESALNLRPFWAFYARTSILSWVTAIVDNVERVTQVVFAESSEEAAGAFGTESVQRYRELFVAGGIAQWRLWRATGDESKPTFTLDGTGVFRNRRGQTRGTLPIAIAYTGRRRGWFQADPPLRGVAYANLAHWRLATELTFGRQVCAIEQPVVNGRMLDKDGNAGTLKLGWMNGVQVEAEGDFKWVGPSGAGLDQLKQGKVEKEQAIAAMGLSFTSRDTRAAETAEAKRLDAAAEDSTLSTGAQAFDDAANQAWQDHCWFLGIDAADAPTVTLNRDFEGTVLSPQAVQAIAALVKEGLPVLRAVQVLIAGGTLKAAPEEAEDIALEWDSARQALADAEADREEAASERFRTAA